MKREPIETATNNFLTRNQSGRNLMTTMMVLTLTLVFIQVGGLAQTPLEQQCMTAVQGKVAWNQAGSTAWGVDNLRNLCQGTTNPSATISCFQNEIRTHNDWSRGINACKLKATAATTTTNNSKPATTITNNSNQAYQKYLGGEPSKTDVLSRNDFLARLGASNSVGGGGGASSSGGSPSGGTGAYSNLGNESGLPFSVDKNYPDFYIIPLEKRPRIVSQSNCGSCVAWATSTALATVIANEGKYPLFVSGMHIPDPLKLFTDAGRTCDTQWHPENGVSTMAFKGVRLSIVEPASNTGARGSSLLTPLENWFIKPGKAGILTNKDAMRKFIATKGALVADMDVTPTFNRYTNGVYDHPNFVALIVKPLMIANQTAAAKDLGKAFSKRDGGHAMTVVGYFKGGTLKLRDFMRPTLPPNADLTPYGNIELPYFPAFWIVQNSYGKWGMNGLMYIAADQNFLIFKQDGTSKQADTIDDKMYYMLEPKLTIDGKESLKIK